MLGAGSWGTALAVHLGRLDHDVCLWARDGALVDEMRASRVNDVYLTGCHLAPRRSRSPQHVADAVAGSDLIVSAIPSHGCRVVIREAASMRRPAPCS